MIKVLCPLHMEQVRQFARAHHCEAALDTVLDYLSNYGDGTNTCELHHDFAPHSFAFLMRRAGGKAWFNGGLIYSGPGQPLDGSFPALTVSIEPTGTDHKWSVHT